MRLGALKPGLNPQWCFCHWPFQGGTPIATLLLCLYCVIFPFSLLRVCLCMCVLARVWVCLCVRVCSGVVFSDSGDWLQYPVLTPWLFVCVCVLDALLRLFVLFRWCPFCCIAFPARPFYLSFNHFCNNHFCNKIHFVNKLYVIYLNEVKSRIMLPTPTDDSTFVGSSKSPN